MESSSVVNVWSRPRVGVLGLLVVGYAVGMAGWLAGYGAGLLVGMGLVLGVLLIGRRQPLPRAVATVAVWSLLIWFVGPLVLRVLPMGYAITSWCLLALTLAPVAVSLAAVRVNSEIDPMARSWAQEAIRPERVLAVCAGSLVFVALSVIACLRFGFAGVAWAMSGDARNHVVATALLYPPDFSGLGLLRDPASAFYGVMTVLSSHPDKAGLSSVDVARLSISGIFAVTLLAACLGSMASGLLLLQFGTTLKRFSVWPVAGASLVATTGIGASVALLDGFTTALLASAVTGLGLVAAISVTCPSQSRRIQAIDVATVLAAFAVVAATWTYAAAGLFLVAVLVAVVAWRRWSMRGRAALAAIALLATVVAADLLPGWVNVIKAQDAFGMSGSITPPNPMWLVFVPAAIAAAGLVYATKRFWYATTPYAAGYVGVVLLVVLMMYMPAGPPQWFYYAAKLTWVWTAATAGLLFLPLLVISERVGVVRSAIRSVTVGVAIACIGLLLVIRSLSPMDSPIWTFDPITLEARSTLAQGWNAPNAGAVDGLFAALRSSGPSVVWAVTDPGNDRLANFWLEIDPATREVNTFTDFRGWAYFQTAEISSLCDLLVRDPERTVVTRDPTVTQQIVDSCRISNPRVEVIG